jgi:LPPG:FO 2-phospho-L-lactate transferase
MMTELGHDASVTGVARLYQPFAGALAVDEADRHLAPAVQAAGMRCVVTNTIMSDPERAADLCRALIAAATGGPS